MNKSVGSVSEQKVYLELTLRIQTAVDLITKRFKPADVMEKSFVAEAMKIGW